MRYSLFENSRQQKKASANIYVGCHPSVNGDDVFYENLMQAQCNSAAIAPDYCLQSNGYNQIYSNAMTVEKCLGICVSTFGFKYAGLNSR